MELFEVNATLGIECEKAGCEKVLGRCAEFCDEMADCYEKGSLEANAFEALSAALGVCWCVEGL